MIFETERLYVTKWKSNDLETLHELYNDTAIKESISPRLTIEETKSIFIGVWDNYNKGLMALPLWTKDMEVFDMKRFYIEVIGSIADTLGNATGDQKMVGHIENLCKVLSKDLQEEIKEAEKAGSN